MLLGIVAEFQKIYRIALPMNVQAEFEQFDVTVRTRLGASAYAAARERGAALPPELVSVRAIAHVG